VVSPPRPISRETTSDEWVSVHPERPGCQHHPRMGTWLDSLDEPVVQSDNDAFELSTFHDWLANLPYPPPGETLAERLTGVTSGWLARGNALAELEQWRKALVWHKDSIDNTWSLCIVRNGATLSYVMPTDGDWLVGRGGQRYPTRDAAMRAAEAALGLPKCRVEGEP